MLPAHSQVACGGDGYHDPFVERLKGTRLQHGHAPTKRLVSHPLPVEPLGPCFRALLRLSLPKPVAPTRHNVREDCSLIRLDKKQTPDASTRRTLVDHGACDECGHDVVPFDHDWSHLRLIDMVRGHDLNGWCDGRPDRDQRLA